MSFFNVDFLTNSPTGKTKIYEVTTLDRSSILGYIKWRGQWRKYVFHPEPHTLFDNKCLQALASKCEELTYIQLRKR